MIKTIKIFTRNIISRILDLSGYCIVKRVAYNQIILQRDNLINLTIDYQNKSFTSGSTVIIFSKDRAIQLYNLLCSIEANCLSIPEIYILYGASTERNSISYSQLSELVKSMKIKCVFINELGYFKEKLLKILVNIETRSVIFFTDDDVFIRPFDFAIANKVDPLGSILSLRHSPLISKSYTLNKNISTPKFKVPEEIAGNGLLEFSWFEGDGEWADPWSVNGQFLPTSEVNLIAMVADYKAPNSFEMALKSFNSLYCKGRRGLCFSHSIILNLPINIVQNEANNRKGSISSDFLLEQWESGMMFDFSQFSYHDPLSTHEEHKPLLISR
jgi:hypothetical protein